MPFEIGQLVGDYEILGVLGKGGMGQVYRVRNTVSNRVEAMKVILPDAEAQSQLIERFMCEIRTLAQLDHPNIAKLNTAFKAENRLVMIMEWVDGKTLCDRALAAPIPLPELLNCADQTLAALSYAHDKGVIHRDIKPSNIMVTTAGTVKLMDFGIAKSSVDPMQTLTGTTVGSTLYMSPEQVRGTAVDHRADIYSLGVLLYEFTAGRRPFEADSMYAILVAQMNTVPEPPVEINPNIPKDLSEIIMTALAKDPAQRFQTAKAFRKALENLREPATVTAQAARPPSVVSPAPAPPPASSVLSSQSDKKANRGLWMVLGAVACVCVLIAAALVLPRFWGSSAASRSPDRMEQPGANTPAQPGVPDTHVAPSTPTAKPTNSTPPPVASVAPAATPPATPAIAPSSRPTPTAHRNSSDQMSAQPSPRVTQTVAQAPAQPAAAPPSGPSQEEIDKVHDGLIQLHSRAEGVRGSVERLRAQQAADGLGLRQDIAGAAARLDMYLHDADRAADANNLDSARKYMNRAEEELSKLESFFGK